MINLFNTKYQPLMLLTIYAENTVEGNTGRHYLESTPVEIDQQGTTTLGAAKPLQVETLKRLGQYLNDSHNAQLTFKGMIPSNVLIATSGKGSIEIVWTCKTDKRNLFFQDQLNIPDGEAVVPNLLFSYKNKSIRVFALGSSRRPGEKTKLYKAPFHNVNEKGELCTGSAKFKNKSPKFYEQIMEDVENIFFNSKFSEIHGAPIEGNLNSFWRAQIKGEPGTFSKEVLVPSSVTLKSIINAKR